MPKVISEDTIRLEGGKVKVSEMLLPLTSLVLDEENPRIGFFRDSQPKDSLTQAEVAYALKVKSPDAYSRLLQSIRDNGGLVNPIWAVPIKDKKYQIIEGNTRTRIYRELADKSPQDPVWQEIRAKVLPKDATKGQINFIRLEAHLLGQTPWDAYERARYLFYLHDKDGLICVALYK